VTDGYINTKQIEIAKKRQRRLINDEACSKSTAYYSADRFVPSPPDAIAAKVF